MSSRVHHFKLVLLGDTAVGKSCLVVRFVRDEFFEFQEPTIGGVFTMTSSLNLLFLRGVLRSLCTTDARHTLSSSRFWRNWNEGIEWTFWARISMVWRWYCLFSICTISLSSVSLPSSAAFLTQTVQLDESTVKFEIWVSLMTFL